MQVNRPRIYTSLSQRQVYIGSSYVWEEVSSWECGQIYIYIIIYIYIDRGQY